MVDERLVVALSHETRAHALSMCSVRPTSTKEIAESLDITVSAAWYHVDKLQALGCIKEDFSIQRRGAKERFYVAAAPYYFDSAAWEQVPEDRRPGVIMGILRLIAQDVDKSVRAKTIEAGDSHLSRVRIDLDQRGREEAYAVLGQALEGLLKVRQNCAARNHRGDMQMLPASVVLMQLELESRD